MYPETGARTQVQGKFVKSEDEGAERTCDVLFLPLSPGYSRQDWQAEVAARIADWLDYGQPDPKGGESIVRTRLP
ncbi:hypothetical protein [Neolewinella antarctica]|uniref:Uncharacterized protein n=1 Tax=Neolewinella antarctica TaxID=442734 RepID=A0ABX0XCS1_9BACT|nr:hypothetical protein [Neolewinella antarctica]NJC27007.1 hypothetical protein [Neolewinella antarctica]